MKLDSIGLVMDADFPAAEHDAVNKRMWAKVGEGAVMNLFGPAWNAVAWRYEAVGRHAAFLDASFARTALNGPQPDERAKQEDALLSLYAGALSSVECSAFAVHIAMSVVLPSDFQTSNARAITLSATAKALVTALPADPLTAVLSALAASATLTRIADIRNRLSHRGAPGRNYNVSVGSPEPESTDWKLTGDRLVSGHGESVRGEVASLVAPVVRALDTFTTTAAF